MNANDWLLAATVAGALALIPFRIRAIARLKTRDQRRFWCFWAWPALFFLLYNAIPVWNSGRALFRAAELALILGLLVDFFYYFALKAPQRAKAQTLAWLGLLPCLAIGFRHLWLPAAPVPATAPHFGRALVWTDRPLAPRTFFFIAPETRKHRQSEQKYDDPNYGKAVFAPIAATFAGFDDRNRMLLETQANGQTLRLAVGPLIRESVSLKPGAPVAQQQPIGLADRAAAGPPGIQVVTLQGKPPRFRDVYAGRLVGWRWSQALPKRNQTIESDAEGRFQARPVD